MNRIDTLSLKQLRLFVVLYRRKHVGETAQELGITQSAASRRLADLEASIGQPLFHREGRKMVPTARADAFVRYAEGALRHLRQGVDAVGGTAEETALHIGALPSVEGALMPAAIVALRARLPHVRLRVDTGSGDQLLPRLRAGEVDAMIGRMPVLGDALRFQPLLPDRLGFFTADDADGAIVIEKPADLLNHPLLLPPPSAVIRPAIEDFFALRGLAMPKDVIEVASPIIAAQLLQTIPAIWAISASAASGTWLRQIRFDAEDTVGAIGLTTRVEDDARPELRILWDVLQQVAKGHAETV